jgi:hypothetical protein
VLFYALQHKIHTYLEIFSFILNRFYEKIPENAVWSGGCDGGYWFEQVDYNSVHNYYRIRIYNDFDGNLELDAEFGVSNTCKREYKFEKDIVSKILLYNGEQIILKEDYCSLDKIKVISGTHNH